VNISILNLIGGFILPLSIVIPFVFWTIKITYSKRFIPTIVLMFLAILTFFIPFILANLDVMDGGIGTGILSIYLSGFIGLGIVANIIVATTIKKDKESEI
jgi:Ca2+/Na+ antiporter